MVKQVVFIFVAFIAFAMGQNQNSQLQSIIAEQVSGLINRTVSDQKLSNSTTSSNSRMFIQSSIIKLILLLVILMINIKF